MAWRSLLVVVGIVGSVSGASAGPPELSAIDHYFVYKTKVSRAQEAKFPNDFNITLNDFHVPDSDADDPENYLVRRATNLAAPGAEGDRLSAAHPDRHYVVYPVKGALEGIGPPKPNGKFPKAVTHLNRRWKMENALGDFYLESTRTRLLWVPAGKDLGSPPAPINGNHFACYRTKTSREPPFGSLQDSKGRLLKNLQIFLEDQFSGIDCATDRDGQPSFEGTQVAGKCLYDLKLTKYLCNPIFVTNVEPPRETTANILPSSPSSTESFVCHNARLARKVLDPAAASLASVPVGTKVSQNRHTKRNGVYTAPSSNFELPEQVDTKGEYLLCIPSEVVSVSAPL